VLLCAALLVAIAGPACDEAPQRADGRPSEGGRGDRSGAGESPVRDLRSGDAAKADGGDTYLPWEGGATYYSKWAHGPSTDPSFFPTAVWLQDPSNAQKYKDIGINTFIGLWEGPTEQQLSSLTSVGVSTICDQAGVWSSHLSDAVIRGWMHGDEPDNAQPDGSGGYGPCIDPSEIATKYAAFKANDATRPIYLNLGQGVANVDYIGRGVCRGKVEMYPEYAKGADILSFDIYPVNNTDSSHEQLWLVASGIDRLREATQYQKVIWTWIETTGIDDPARKPTPAQVKAEVWMALIHGAMGIGYFCHIMGPTFVEAGLLADATMKNAVAEIDAQIHSLAPALNTPSLAAAAQVASSNAAVPVDLMVKRQGGTLYLFAVAMRPGATTATFTLPAVSSGSVEVLGEGRSLAVKNSAFSDTFAASFAVHLYKITP
jgi:hypothetical protein